MEAAMNALTLWIFSVLAAPPAVAPAPKSAPAPAPASAVAAAPAADAAHVVDGIQSFYATTKDLTAKFTQTYTYKVHDRTQVRTGTVFFKKPRMMRWDYATPQKQLFVADGATLWVYEPGEAQVFKRSLADSQLPVALTFMTGEGKLADEFDAKLLPAPDAAHYLVELIPKRDEGDYKSLRLLVDRQTFAVKTSTVVDPVGNINQVDFGDVQTNLGLPDKGFHFDPPQGVRVITDSTARNAP
jgi:outer membrane lipoprotein carrier protein